MPGMSVNFLEILALVIQDVTARYLNIQAVLWFPGTDVLGITGSISMVASTLLWNPKNYFLLYTSVLFWHQKQKNSLKQVFCSPRDAL